jgi:hypothetical protein
MRTKYGIIRQNISAEEDSGERGHDFLDIDSISAGVYVMERDAVRVRALQVIDRCSCKTLLETKGGLHRGSSASAEDDGKT